MARIRRHRRDTVQSPLETYLREINEMALLTADEEKMLAHRIAEGDKLARDRMVRANLRLVVNIARGYVGKGLALQDLIEEGNLGLLRAVQGFDPAVGTRFSTYASYWIKQSIKRALVNTAKPIRIPAYMVELLFKWRRMAADLQDALGRPATHRGDRQGPEAAQEEAGHRQEGDQGLQPRAPDRPARERLEPGRDAHGRADPRPGRRDGRGRQPPAGPATGSTRWTSARRPCSRMRFGLNDAPPKTLKEIGESLGLTRERVRQIENEALGKLSASFQAD